MSQAVVLTNAEAERQDIVDNAIMELIEQLNPGEPLEWDIEDIATVRAEIAAILVKKGRCTEHEFYPYLEINRDEDDPDKPFLSYQGVDVWICWDDDEMQAAFHYTTDLGNGNIDNDDCNGTMFDVREIPHPDSLESAVTWRTTTSEYGSISSEDTAGRDAHANIIRFAIAAGWLTQDGLKLPEEA